MSAPHLSERAFIDESQAILERTPLVLDTLLRNLPDSWLQVKEGPGTWSPLIVLGHLIHSERHDWMPRVETILLHGAGKPFDPVDRQAHLLAVEGQSIGDLLNEFADLRKTSLLRWRQLQIDPGHLSREGHHQVLGTVTLRQLLATWTTHDMAHLLQISRVMAKRYREDVGPWASYLSVLR